MSPQGRSAPGEINFEVLDPSDSELERSLEGPLAHACRHLARAGVQRVLGPMDGSTWASYRLVTERAVGGGQEQPPFFMEPWNPPSYPEAFRKAGFESRQRDGRTEPPAGR